MSIELEKEKGKNSFSIKGLTLGKLLAILNYLSLEKFNSELVNEVKNQLQRSMEKEGCFREDYDLYK